MPKLYTRTGDDGSTGLFGGLRVRTTDRRVEAYGTIDELNAQLGVVRASIQPRSGAGWDTLRQRLARIQNELFVLGAELATPVAAAVRDRIPATTAEHVAGLEAWIDEASAAVPPLRVFILPGGDIVAALLHVGRTVCRRAERCAASAAESEAINPQILVYLNRLSDLLFAWARWANQLAGVEDVTWENTVHKQAGEV